jgi:hypothetical protein
VGMNNNAMRVSGVTSNPREVRARCLQSNMQGWRSSGMDLRARDRDGAHDVATARPCKSSRRPPVWLLSAAPAAAATACGRVPLALRTMPSRASEPVSQRQPIVCVCFPANGLVSSGHDPLGLVGLSLSRSGMRPAQPTRDTPAWEKFHPNFFFQLTPPRNPISAQSHPFPSLWPVDAWDQIIELEVWEKTTAVYMIRANRFF